MTAFYTNFHLKGNSVYLRGFDTRGVRFKDKIPLTPYLFVPSNKPGDKQPYKTLDGSTVYKMSFDNVSDAKEFIERYSEVDNFPIYGSHNFQYVYINDRYQGIIDYDQSKVVVANIDIETSTKKIMNIPNKKVRVRKKK